MFELRKASAQNIVKFLDEHKSELVTIQEINESLFKDFEERKELKLLPLDEPFCDGILFPRSKLTFNISEVKSRFEDVDVCLDAKTVKPSMQEGYWFVKLNEDSTISIAEVKGKLLILMRKLRKELGSEVYLK